MGQKKRNMETGLLILNQHKKIQEMSSVGNIKMSSACGCKGESSSSSMKCQSLNTQEAQSLMFEGGSDVFTSNRHTLHNNEARSFNMMNFRTQDDAPFFRLSLQSPGYVSATVPVEREGCERVTSL